MLSQTTVCRQNPDIPSTEVDGEVMLMSSETGRYYTLTGSAAAIWKTLEQETTVAELCEKLTCQFQVDRQTCLADVAEFIDALTRNRLIHTTEA